MKRGAHPDDPRNLIGEAFRIEGIGVEDCRAIFFDWALGLPQGTDPAAAASALRAHHRAPPEHPMTQLLEQAAEGVAVPRGRRGRRRR